MTKKVLAELLGSFWLMLGGCGSVALSVIFPELDIGFLGMSLAFGLAVIAMVYVVGAVSGGHFNPAVTLGLWVTGRFPFRETFLYILMQVLGAMLAGGVLYFIVMGNHSEGDIIGRVGNGYNLLVGYRVQVAFLTEMLMTTLFLLIIVCAK